MQLAKKVLTVVFSVFFVEQVNLIVQHLDAHEHCPFFALAATEGLHLSSLWTLLVDVLVVIILVDASLVCVNTVKEEGQQNQVMVEVLH